MELEMNLNYIHKEIKHYIREMLAKPTHGLICHLTRNDYNKQATILSVLLVGVKLGLSH
jgi:hypothetical protein